MKPTVTAVFVCALLLCTGPAVNAQQTDETAADGQVEFYDPFEDDSDNDLEPVSIPDPLQPFNRAMFHFNDFLYFYLMQPLAKGYSYVVPEPGRKSIKRFFTNLSTPIRFVNCLLQGKFKGAGVECARFVINTTAGIGGFFDPAASRCDMEQYSEDTGQTLGLYGLGPGFYLYLPFFGPSSGRDALGRVGDMFLDPLMYVKIKTWERAALKVYAGINAISLNINAYEEFKEASIDPYIALRNAYFQNRESAVKK